MRCSFLPFLLFGFLAASSLLGQSLTTRLDSILASPRDTHQVLALANLSRDLSDEMMDVPEALFDEGFALADELDYDWGVAILSTERYFKHFNAGELKEGMSYVLQTIEYAQKCGDKNILREAHGMEIEFLIVGGEHEKAAEKASKFAQKSHESGDLIGECRAYISLATLSSGLGDRVRTEAYDSTAVVLAKQSGSKYTLASALFSQVNNLNQLGLYEKALPLIEELLLLVNELGYKVMIGNALSERAEANTALGNYDVALKDYDLLKVGEGGQRSAYRIANKGKLLQRVGRHDESRALLLEAVDMFKKGSNDAVKLKSTYQALQTVGLNQTQYDTVVYYGKLMAAQQDSLQTAENIKNILELEEKYEAHERADQIEQQERELSLRKAQLYITAAGLLFALLAGLAFFTLNRRLKKRNVDNERLVAEKETLIGEIHHRVKNNLQVVSSLLQIQRRGLESDDEKGREALLESQNRVSAMGLIHNKLYQGRDVTSVHMPEYLEDLGETLLDAYRLEEQVEIFYDVEDINLDVDNAIPLGLIINELVTNSLKYAFPKGREGTIEISLHREEQGLKLRVSDDGVGALAAEKRADSTFFGTNLIGLLTKKLKGELSILDDQGYTVEILFNE